MSIGRAILKYGEHETESFNEGVGQERTAKSRPWRLAERPASYNEGFTLVEALVTLVVLSIALGPSLILTSNVNNTASVVRNNLIAANLAQEGLEVIRGIRDTNWFLDNSFDQGLSDGTYRVEWNSETLLALGSNPPLKENNGFYNYSTGTDTLFRRTISVLGVNESELRIISEVTWQERGARDRSVMAESHLFNWR